MSAHTQPATLPIRIPSDDGRTIEVEVDQCGVWMHDITDVDCHCEGQSTLFPTLDDAERVALRLLAAVRAARGR